MTQKYLNAALAEDFLKSMSKVFNDYRDKIDSKQLNADKERAEDMLMNVFIQSNEIDDEALYPTLRLILQQFCADKALHGELLNEDFEFFQQMNLSFDSEDQEFSR